MKILFNARVSIHIEKIEYQCFTHRLYIFFKSLYKNYHTKNDLSVHTDKSMNELYIYFNPAIMMLF